MSAETAIERAATVWERENERQLGIARYSDLADRISWLVAKRHLGWLCDITGAPYEPTTAHDEHLYDGACAICKAGHAPVALRIVIDAVLDALVGGPEGGTVSPQPDLRVEFGSEYEDVVTGFTGVATARTETIHGNVSVCLERADNDGKPEEVWLPERRLHPCDEPPAKKVGL